MPEALASISSLSILKRVPASGVNPFLRMLWRAPSCSVKNDCGRSVAAGCSDVSRESYNHGLLDMEARLEVGVRGTLNPVHSRLRSTIDTGLRDLFSGTICGVVSIVYCVSYAAFIFSGPLAPWLGYGIGAIFISTTIGAFVVALRAAL